MVPWSSGYDISFTPRRSQVRSLVGPYLNKKLSINRGEKW